MPEWISDVNTNIDKAFELTHLPQLAEGAGRWVGSGFDDLLGTNITPTVSAISRDLPRMTAEALATLPLMATGAGAPVAAATWMNRLRRLGQVAGYGSSAVGGWDATGSPLGGAIAAGSLGLGNKLFTGANRGGWDVGLAGQEAAERLAGFTPRQIVAEEGANTLSKNLIEGGAKGALDAKTLFQQLVSGAGRGVTDVGAGVGLAEASRQGMMSVGDNAVGLDDPARNPFTAENVAGNVLNALPMAIGAISAARVKTSPKQVAQLHDWMNERRKAQAIEAGYDYEGPITPTQYHDTFGAVPADMQPDGTQSPLAAVRQDFDAQGQVVPTENYWDAVDPMDQELAKRKKRVGASVAVTKSLETHFNVLEQQIAEGNTEGADETYRMIHRAFNGGGDLMTQDGRDYVTGKIKELDARARQMVPGDAPELVGFIEEVNNTIDMWNKEFERTKGIRTAQITDPAFTVKTMDDLKRFNEAKKVANAQRAEQSQVLSEEGKTWSSKATEPIGTVEALDKAGLIEPLTQDWFKGQMAEEMKRSSPEEAYKIVLQKAVNQKLSQIPDALAKYKEMPQPDTSAYEQSGIAGQATKNRAKVDALEQMHYANFLRFPAEMREALARRDIDARSMGEFGGKKGRLENRYGSWRKALDLAARTYDPVTDTIMVYEKGGQKRVPADWWIQRDDFGDYAHELASAPLSVAEGGTGRIGGKAEKTLTDLTAEAGQGADALERLDEEAFKSAVVVDEKLKGSFDDQENGLLGTGKSGEQVIPEQMGAEDVMPEAGLYLTEEQTNAKIDLFETKQRLQKRLAELSSEEAYYAGKTAFKGEGTPEKKKLFKSAVMAALEDSQTGKGVDIGPAGQEFLKLKRELGENPAGDTEKERMRRALKAYFGFQVKPPFPGAKLAVKSKIETRYDMQRLAHIVGSLLDDKKVEMARSIVAAQGGVGVAKPSAGPNSPVQYSAPIRLQRWLASPNGGLMPDARGELPTKSVRNLLQKLGVSKDEMELYDAAGLSGKLAGEKVNMKELAKWMDEVTPEVEVKKLAVGGNKFDVFSGLQHRAETLGFRAVADANTTGIYEIDGFTDLQGRPLSSEDMTPAQMELADEMISNGYAPAAGSDAATGRYGVDPKSLDQMPGAVDILVRVPLGEAQGVKIRPGTPAGEANTLFRGPHFGDSDVNVLASVRGYMETLPNGEKVFHVFEVQSDWGQKAAKAQQEKAAQVAQGLSERAARQFDVNNHPLLAQYEQLALKTAIKHAREQGATRIALSDAETAMMTEGHDRAARTQYVAGEYFDPKLKGVLPQGFPVGDRLTGKISVGEDGYVRVHTEIGNKVSWDNVKREGMSSLQKIVPTKEVVTQEPGMRAAYDQRLPRMLGKLTKDRGMLADFGKHDKGLSPVFNKDNITARTYSLANVPDEFAAFGYAKPSAGTPPANDLTGQDLLDYRLEKEFGAGAVSLFDDDGNLVGLSLAKDFEVPVENGVTVRYDSRMTYAQFKRLQEHLREYNIPDAEFRDVAQTVLSDQQSAVPHDLLVNTQPPGTFTADVYRTFRHHFSKVLGDTGYSGSIRDLYTEMAVAIAQTAPNEMVDFYSIVGEKKKAAAGLANRGSSGPGRGQVGVNFNAESGLGRELHYAQRILSTLAHEISHIDDFILEGMIDAPDAFSEKRRQLRQNLNALSEIMTPDERHSILTVIQEALVPKGSRWDSTMEDGRKYGSHSPIEFVAVLNETIAMSLLHGKSTGLKNALEVLDYSPTEVRDYAQGMFRSLHDVLAGMQDVVAHPFVRKAAGVEALPVTNTYITSTLLGAAVNAAKEASLLRHADKVLANARGTIGALSPGAAFSPPRAPSNALWMQTASDIDAMNRRIRSDTVLSQAALPSVMGAITQAGKSMSKQAYDRAHAEGTWFGWFAPFTQRMEALQRGGFPIARPMADLAIGMEGSITRLRSFLLGDFVKRGPDGKVDINHENPLVKRISEERSGPWRDAVNEMSAWQQSSNDAKALFITDPKTGQVMPDPQNKKGVAKWEAVSKRLSPEDQQFVAAAMVAGDKMAQTSAQVTLTALREQIEYRIATVLMSANKGMQYEQAVPFGKQVSDAFINRAEAQKAGNQQVMAQADQALAQLLPTPQARAVIDTYFGGKDGVLDSYLQASETLNGRTGHRPEQLQHDWVLRVKNPQGEVKYLSERSEYAANWRMRELAKEGYTQEGEIVTKDKLKNFTDVDDPDTLLRKYSEIEGRVWNKTIADVEANLGAQVAEQLQAYVPGTASIADATTAGLQKYIKNRKGVVDRTKFDYIDGLQTNASRLAASIGYKKTQNMKNIMLSDPRARQFPSFAAMVNEHFDEMMTPTSNWSKEVKTASSAYMMGANISSMLINAAQSVTSLVPVLIQQDMKGMGPVAAWKLLGRAVADAADISTSKNWETRAALAERVDPKKQTLEEAKVALYRKRVLEGGIDHGIIHDSVFSGTDQQALMLARFGHGQYPPLSKAEMIRNPIYYVSQLALKPFGMVEQFNNKISFMAGVEQGHGQGLRGDELYQYARRVQTLSTYGGGKANAPGVVAKMSNPYTRSAFGIVNNLQQYGYGMVTTYAQLLRDSLGKDTTLSPLERKQSQKALGTMLTTQVALAGALGLPFAGAALAGLEKVFGIPANQLVREGLASLGSDDEQGAWLAETALNGLGNQLFGVDVSSRLGVSNLLGTSSYRGFNLSDLAGPTGGIIGNTVEALNLFGTDSPAKAAKALVPVAFKTVVEMSDSQRKYGDYGMRDAGGSLLYQPTKGEAIGYMLGFRPRELSQKRQAQAMLKGVEQRSQDRVSKELGGIADALTAGDAGPAMAYVRETTFHDPTVNPQDLLRSLVQRGVDRQTEKDLLSTGSRASEQERGQVARTFGPDVVTRQSEVQRALLGATLGARVGLAPDPKTFQKAALVDVLVQQRGMVRSEALRLAGFLE